VHIQFSLRTTIVKKYLVKTCYKLNFLLYLCTYVSCSLVEHITGNFTTTMNKSVVEPDIHKDKNSLVNGTNDREACKKRWIAVLVQVNCEKKVASQLNKAGYETYIPTQQEVHQWSDRKKKIDRLIIPMVVFVRATENEEEWLRNQSFIHKLLALPGSDEDKKKFATPIPDNQIKRLKFLLEKAESEVTIVSNIKVGDSVRVISGPLKGLEGVVSEADEKSSIVGVQIDGLGYACVKIAKKYLIS